MIEQKDNQIILTFPTADSATTFAAFLSSLFQVSGQPVPGNSEPPSTSQSIQDSPVPERSHHVVLTPEREEALFNQRQQGQTARQRVLRTQTTLRDGTLPFRALDEPPLPSGQVSPRQKAQAEGGFADGQPGVLPEAERRRGSRLRPVLTSEPSPQRSRN